MRFSGALRMVTMKMLPGRWSRDRSWSLMRVEGVVDQGLGVGMMCGCGFLISGCGCAGGDDGWYWIALGCGMIRDILG